VGAVLSDRARRIVPAVGEVWRIEVLRQRFYGFNVEG
jgi:hypothetical protein